MDDQKPISTPPHIRTNQLSKRSNSILEIRRTMGVQQRKNQGRRQMESSLHHQSRTVRTTSNVLRTHKLISNLSDDDERNLRNGAEERMGINLHGRHPNP